jgi:hypothetical protein
MSNVVNLYISTLRSICAVPNMAIIIIIIIILMLLLQQLLEFNEFLPPFSCLGSYES